MNIQLIILALFLLNLALLWTSYLTGKITWYKWPGFVTFSTLPLLSVFPDQPRFALDFHWFWLSGFAFITLGVILAAWSKLEFIKRPKKFVATGPYLFIRHPLYLGGILLYVGWWWVWSAVYAFYCGMFIIALIWIHAYLEERLIMEKKFGDQYRQYRRSTGMFWIK